MRIFGAKRANDFIQLLRRSIIHQKDYISLDNIFKKATGDGIRQIPPRWGAWTGFVRKSRVQPRFEFGDLVATAKVLRTHDIDTPWDLARGHKPRIDPPHSSKKGPESSAHYGRRQDASATTTRIRKRAHGYFPTTTPSASRA